MNYDRTTRLVIFVALTMAVSGLVAIAYQRGQSAHVAAILQSTPSPLFPDGTLIRDDGDDRVYYIDGGTRRWIESAQVFQAQGFHADDIRNLSAAEVLAYPQGPDIDQHSLVALPGERATLPDIAPLAPYALRLARVGGRAVIRFTGSFWNKGGQSFDLVPGADALDATGRAPVYERITATDGRVRLKLIDNFVYHPAHHHLHLEDFGYYLLQPISLNIDPSVSGNPFVHIKTTFCMRDDAVMTQSLPGVPSGPVFRSCGTQGQGVSVGWIDVYPYTLSDQYVDVQDMPPGVYGLSFMLDAQQHYLEERKDNNIATTFVQLDVAHGVLRVLASLAPFETAKNTAVDGTLIRTQENGNVYVLSGGHKRWLRSVDIFNAYGYSWTNVYPVTQAMAEVIPSQRLVRLEGSQEVYVLNDAGFRRHILSPQVLASYGFTASDITNVNQTEFYAYHTSSLIVLQGSADVYAIEGATKYRVGPLMSLGLFGYDSASVQMVNQTDFDSYAVAP